jgi:Zn-dependent protease with chaperone function
MTGSIEMTQTPVVIQHPPAERITLHALGLAVFVLMGGVLSHTIAGLDEKIAALAAFIIAICVWFAGDFWSTRRHGLMVRFEWSARSHRLRLVVAQQWTTLLSARFHVADYYGNEPLMHGMEVKEAIIRELATIADRLKCAPQIHIVGLDAEDSAIFMRLVRQALEREGLDSI